MNYVQTYQPGVSVTRSQIRTLIDRLLPNDAALNAFCLDHFDDIYRQFSAGMERRYKVNLLLEDNDRLPELVRRLSGKKQALRTIHRRLPWNIVIFGGASTIALGIFWAQWLRQPAPGKTLLPSLPSSALLYSNPAADVVFDHRFQGRTPFDVQKLPTHVQKLCLQARFYEDLPVEIHRQQDGRPVTQEVTLKRRKPDEGSEETIPECWVE